MNTYGNKLDIMKKGYLIHKKHTKIFVILCLPLSISDVSTVYYSIFGGNGLENRAAILGNIAFAAMEETPLLILLASEKETSRPIFIHFMNVNSIDDEVKLGQACCMRLHTTKADFTFSASTSTDYQEWIYALKDAYNRSHPSVKRRTVNTGVDDVDDMYENSNYTVDNVDPGMFIPYSSHATLTRSRSAPKTEKPLLGRLFSQCIPDTNNSSSKQTNSNKIHHHNYNQNIMAARKVPAAATATMSSRGRTTTTNINCVPSSPKKSEVNKTSSNTQHVHLPSSLPENPVTTTVITPAPLIRSSNYNDMPPLSPSPLSTNTNNTLNVPPPPPSATAATAAAVAASTVLPSPPPPPPPVQYNVEVDKTNSAIPIKTN
ncbi:hypothetical protein BCR36DRAFT_317832 [Piromyces finnis]|uniref:PH domain-containing protein n=1 Tax=Piromyces finnis TaxID=1754191 RepID=A0A1Y1VK36_9FUNG|nr:hypothetical protein BCR36DRAFT_317832 [Piromyces finnis]|eukprot:ORX58454.1 hypothetical protein BCR36DRAFT_317832 [Piromyces finnis]